MPRHGLSLDHPPPTHVRTEAQIRDLLNLLGRVDTAAIDTETTGLKIARDYVIFWSLSTGQDRYFLTHDQLSRFAQVFKDPNRTWFGTNTKYDFHMLANSGHELAGDMFDTLVMDRLVDSSRPHGLKECIEREFDEKVPTFSETFYPRNKEGRFKKPGKRKGMEHAPTMQDIITGTYDGTRAIAEWEAENKDRAKHKQPLLTMEDLEYRKVESMQSVVEYASLDAWDSYRLVKKLETQLQGIITQNGYSLYRYYIMWEVPLHRVLYNMERRGVLTDRDHLSKLEAYFDEQTDRLKLELTHIYNSCRKPHQDQDIFVPERTRMVQELLFDRLGLEPTKETESGQRSVDKTVLDYYADQGIEAAKLIKTYRELTKLKGTYVTSILEDGADFGGVIHTTFNQHVAKTSRLSSSDPALQNIPARTEQGKEIRKAYIPRPKYVMGDADYEQVEMYILADIAGATGMIKNINEGRDIHSSNVELVWGFPYEDVISAREKKGRREALDAHEKLLLKKRDDVKTVGFGLVYGTQARALSRTLKFLDKWLKDPELDPWQAQERAIEEAQDLIDLFFKGIPEVRKFIEDTHLQVASEKYTETLMGRRRWFRDIMETAARLDHLEAAKSRGQKLCWCAECKLSRDAEREAVNHRIQGTSADITQMAMVRCTQDRELVELDCHLLIQVHDEIVFEVREENAKRACEIIQYHMENPGLRLSVPLRAQPSLGNNWIQAKQ
jgi:DNA polymerase-1